MRWLFLLLLAFGMLLGALTVEARMHAPYRGHRIVPTATAPLDGFTQPAAAYSFRKLRSAYTGPAVKLRRTTGGTSDIGFAGNDFDTAAATTFCAATTCFLDTWYDQSGNARHATQATTADQPQYIADCGTGKPCARSPLGASDYLIVAGITAATPLSLNSVARQTARSSTGCREIWFGNGNELNQHASLDFVLLSNGSASFQAVSAGLAWHSHIGVMSGASSVINVDGTETSGTVSPNLTAGNIVLDYNLALGATCDVSEAMAWSGYALTLAERTALQQNQRDYWMPLPLDTFIPPAAAYSLRKLRSAYAGPAIRIKRASDSGQLDIGFLGFVPGLGAPLDVATANAHCAATTCTVVTWYDQSGNVRHVTATGGEPALVFSCQNGSPCMQTTASGPSLQSAGVAWVAAKTSFSVVANRSAGTGQCFLAVKSANVLRTDTAGNWGLTDFTGGSMTMAAADNAWHAGVSITDGTNSLMRIDAIETPVVGSIPGVSTAGVVGASYGAAATTCSQGEMILWDNYALTLAERTALTADQRSYWMPLPLDTFAPPAAAYSLRKLKSTYSGPAIRLRRASDNAELDIGFVPGLGSPLDIAAANTHCAATSCFVPTWYDQSGAAGNLNQAAAGSQPAFIFNCNGTLPCIRTTVVQYLAVTVTPVALQTLSVVGKRSAGTGLCYWLTNNDSNQFISQNVTANAWTLTDGASPMGATATDGVWHAASGVINGASSVLRIDAAEVSSVAIAGSVASGGRYAATQFSSTGTTCDEAEAVLWQSYALTAPERAALQANQKSFWGTP